MMQMQVCHFCYHAMDTRSRTNEWFADQCTPELLDKFDKGLAYSLTKKEFAILQALHQGYF